MRRKGFRTSLISSHQERGSWEGGGGDLNIPSKMWARVWVWFVFVYLGRRSKSARPQAPRTFREFRQAAREGRPQVPVGCNGTL